MRKRGGREAVGGSVKPADAVVAPEPGSLTAHVASGSGERQFTGPVDVGGSCACIEGGEHLPVTQRAGRGDAVPQPAIDQGPDLADQTCVEHAVGSDGEPLVESCCVPI